MSSNGKPSKHSVNHQVWWLDLEAWVQQLHEQFGGYCHIEVALPPGGYGLKQAVRLEVVKRGVGKEQDVLWEGWQHFNWGDSGHCEKVALQLVSRALLELSGDAERSERLAQLPL